MRKTDPNHLKTQFFESQKLDVKTQRTDIQSLCGESCLLKWYQMNENLGFLLFTCPYIEILRYTYKAKNTIPTKIDLKKPFLRLILRRMLFIFIFSNWSLSKSPPCFPTQISNSQISRNKKNCCEQTR